MEIKGRPYTGRFRAVTVSALQDIWEALAATGKPLVIIQVELGQTSDLGDAAEEILAFEAVRGIGATSGSGGSSVTPQQVNNNDIAAGFTLERNNTTQLAAGGGSLETLEGFDWNIRQPGPKIWVPEIFPIVLPGDYWTCGLPTGPTDALTFDSTIHAVELV